MADGGVTAGRALATVLAALALAGGAAADTVYLWGAAEPIEGEVLSGEGPVLRVRKADGTVVEIPREKVKRVVSAAEAAEAATAEAERAAREAAERAQALSRPLPPSADTPAGGWLLLFGKQPQGQAEPPPAGFRQYRFAPASAGEGFELRVQEYRVDEHGRPRHTYEMAFRFDRELKSEGCSARLVARGRRRADDDTVDRWQVGGGRIRFVTAPAGQPAAPAIEMDVPGDTQFVEAVLARFLQGDLAMDCWDGKVAEIAPLTIPNRWVILNGGKGPEGEPWPATGRLRVEFGKGEEKNVEGYDQLIVKMREEYPGTSMPALAHRVVFGLKPGKPVRVLAAMQPNEPIGVMADLTRVRASEVFDTVPDRWRDVTAPDPPVRLGE